MRRFKRSAKPVHIWRGLWHKHGIVKPALRKKTKPPLDEESLQSLALFYVGRFATTRARLARYLERKITERGWNGSSRADPAALAQQLSDMRYVDDEGFAEAKAASLARKGYGARRVADALQHSGVEAEQAAGVLEGAKTESLATAIRLAKRKRLGPFAAEEPDRKDRQRAFAAMVRGGHAPDIINFILNRAPGDFSGLDGEG